MPNVAVALDPPPDLAGGMSALALEIAGLGGPLPPAVACELEQAAASYGDDATAERHLHAAYRLAPEHAAVHIGLYRFYFYKNRLREALAVGERCLATAARHNALPADWRAVTPGAADFASYAMLPRSYLFTLKACAYLHLRLGELGVGAAMVAKLIELDPADRLGGSVLRDVLRRLGNDDDE